MYLFIWSLSTHLLTFAIESVNWLVCTQVLSLVQWVITHLLISELLSPPCIGSVGTSSPYMGRERDMIYIYILYIYIYYIYIYIY